MSKYIVIDSEGNIEQTDDLSKELIKLADDDEIKLIGISGNQPNQYIGGGWWGIDTFKLENKD